MGNKNSSITRVIPVFDYINRDREKLNKFFSLFDNDVTISSDIREYKYGYNEAVIAPCRELLIWCVNNVNQLKKSEFEKLSSQSDDTARKRYALYRGDENIKNKALAELREPNLPQRAWYIFEGYTHPDVYVETDDAIFIGEAKRTEPKLTDSTKWLPVRDQLIRHVDSVIESEKKVYSFLLRDDSSVYPLDDYKDISFFQRSLPHRDDTIVKKVMDSYIGCTTWNAVNNLFGNEIEYPETTEDA